MPLAASVLAERALKSKPRRRVFAGRVQDPRSKRYLIQNPDPPPSDVVAAAPAELTGVVFLSSASGFPSGATTGAEDA
jgi:hypothetical protein